MTITLFTVEQANQVLDIKDVVKTGFTWSTDVYFTAGELNFTISGYEYLPQYGDKVSLQWRNQKVFVGYVFEWEATSEGDISVVAYDALRYLKSQDTLVLPVQSLKDRFEQICRAVGIPHKTVSSAEIKVPAGFYDGQTYFDVLKTATDTVYKASGVLYFLRDNYGTVELISTRNTVTDFAIGDDALGHDWGYQSSINDAYNVVKVVKSDAEKGIQMVAVAEGDNIEHWGRLQKIERADDKDTQALMDSKARDLLANYNKDKRTLQLSNVIGYLGIRAGTVFSVDFKALERAGVKDKQAYAAKVTHTFGQVWTMDVEVRYE